MGLRISNRNFNSGKIKTVTTPPVPVVNFIGSPLSLTMGETASFTDLSTNNPTAWSWSFPSGSPSTSTQQNPTIQFNTPGSQSITLSATNLGGTASLTKTNYINVISSFVLDIAPNAAAAFSVRKLRSNYTGSCLRVRRSSDNTEQDIGFINNELDTTSLTSFVGAGNGFVTKWYDQSGNVNDLIQSTTSLQPQIVSSGTILKENNKPILRYYAVNSTSLSLTSIIAHPSSWSCFATMGRSSTGDIMASMTNTTTVFPYASVTFNDGLLYMASTTYYGRVNYNLTGLKLFSTFWTTSPSSLFTAYINNVNQAVNQQIAGAAGSFEGVGKRGGQNSNGYISECIFYTSNQITNQSVINSNIVKYFGLT